MVYLKETSVTLMVALCMTFPSEFAIAEDILWVNYHIHITNDLPMSESESGEPSLYMHCKYKNKDLGEKGMIQHEDYTWDTKINLFRTTLFFCHAVWVNHKERHFVAFKATRDENQCMVYHFSCLWMAREDGIYFSKDQFVWTNAYPW
ncbi:putative Leucine-rich repeat receptor-like protein kinase family protein [Hibiscus syriacus]|uniref:S-protein homolog n=1 Tax=Hibiscus syriacus TaxID=106335 RepID=A0A6A3C8M0_HIBSY|nr:S-protein homolog 18-like [Hibiscus syriacus]KAE8724897.1 putative Leucine-rich repeat receptor-like protein kinase family protein [Hibiscus syriacus]